MFDYVNIMVSFNDLSIMCTSRPPQVWACIHIHGVVCLINFPCPIKVHHHEIKLSILPNHQVCVM